MHEKDIQLIGTKDRDILRQLATKQAEFSASEKNASIIKQWQAQAKGERETPTVRLLFSNFMNEVVYNRRQCENEIARKIEDIFLTTLVGRELFDDDTPIPDFFNIPRDMQYRVFGAMPERGLSTDEGSIGYHIDPVVTDLEEDFHLLEGGSYGMRTDEADEIMAAAIDCFSDILPSKFTMSGLTGFMTNPLVHLMGMEDYYLAMYDAPELLHKAMDMATELHLSSYDYMEENGLLLPTNDYSFVCQESFGFTDELPRDKVTKTTECWGFLESQETTAVSPETFGEFVYPYQSRLVERFGLLSYGCCERVDAILDDYILKWKNLRKLSVSPFNDEYFVGDRLRGKRIVYYSKPRAEFVTNPGPIDVDALKNNFKMVCEASSGCLLEVAQREVGTIFSDYSRGKQYVNIIRECIDEYWKP